MSPELRFQDGVFLAVTHILTFFFKFKKRRKTLRLLKVWMTNTKMRTAVTFEKVRDILKHFIFKLEIQCCVHSNLWVSACSTLC